MIGGKIVDGGKMFDEINICPIKLIYGGDLIAVLHL